VKRLIAIAALALVTAACGDSNEVGSGVDLNVAEQAEDVRLGETTTTAAPAEATGEQLALGETTTTAAPTTTTVAVTLQIAINGDSGTATQFEPAAARVYVGSLVEWVNNDTVPRSVIADNGAFDSGEIPPGGTFRFTAGAPGQIAYTDGTRPYAVATLEVISQ
jgi:plastocyanin